MSQPSPARAPLGEVLVAWLEAALGDDEARRTLEDARRLAKVVAVPTESDELVGFVQGPLGRALARLFDARLAGILVRSLEAELDAALAAPPSSSEQARPSQARRRALLAGADPTPPRRASTLRLRRKRPVIALLLPDPLGRSVVARTLVQGECEVRALEPDDDVLPDDVDLALVDLTSTSFTRSLETILRAHPTLPVLVWTSMPLAEAARAARSHGARRRLAVNRDVHGRELLELVHYLAATLRPDRRDRGERV